MADFQNAMCNGEMLKCLFKLFSGQCGVGAQHFTASQYYFAINKLICQQRMFGIVGDQTQFFTSLSNGMILRQIVPCPRNSDVTIAN